MTDNNSIPAFARHLVNLAASRLGAETLSCPGEDFQAAFLRWRAVFRLYTFRSFRA